MKQNIFSYIYSVILLLIFILFFLIFRDKWSSFIALKDQVPILIINILVLLVIGFHTVYILFNYNVWVAKRDFETTKYQLKKEKHIEEHRGLISDLIKNDYNFKDITQEHQLLLERLGLGNYIKEKANALMDLSTKLTSFKSKEELINSLPEGPLKQEIQTIDTLKDQIKHYEYIFNNLKDGILKLVECNLSSQELLRLQDKLGTSSNENLKAVGDLISNAKVTIKNSLAQLSDKSIVVKGKIQTIEHALTVIHEKQTELNSGINGIDDATIQIGQYCADLSNKIIALQNQLAEDEKQLQHKITTAKMEISNLEKVAFTAIQSLDRQMSLWKRIMNLFKR